MSHHLQTPNDDEWRNAPAIIFDFNGTLSEDEDVLEGCYEKALIALGFEGLSDGEYARLLGLSEPDIARELLLAGRLSKHEELDATVGRLLSELSLQYLAHCTTSPCIPECAVQAVRTLSRAGFALGIVTGTLRELIEPALKARGIREFFRCVLTIEDVRAGKPDPEGFLKAAELLGVHGKEGILVLEDSGAGVAAAKAAGMIPIAIAYASGHRTGYHTICAMAQHVERIFAQ